MRNDTAMIRALTTGLLISLLAAGCKSSSSTTPLGGISEADCPDDIEKQITLSASAISLNPPAPLTINAEVGNYPAKVARRVMIAVTAQDRARDMRVLSSTLSMTTLGGTLAGWAAIGPDLASSNAVDVIPGRLRIRPFLGTAKLKNQTMAVDVFISPGSVPIDEMTVATTPLWTAEQQAVQPDAVQLELSTVRHLSVFDVVEGTVQLELLGAPSRSAREHWHCSFVSRFELVDHDSVLPDLWGLRVIGGHATANQWLALDDPTYGPFRAVFVNPERARGFAAWLRATTTTRVSQYTLGVLQLKEPEPGIAPASNRSIATPFRGLSDSELSLLEVKRLGE